MTTECRSARELAGSLLGLEGVDRAGHVAALEKVGGIDDDIRREIDRYREAAAEVERLKAKQKIAKEEMEGALQAITALRAKSEDLGDLFVLAEREREYLEEAEALSETKSEAYLLLFGEGSEEASARQMASVRQGVLSDAWAFCERWVELGHLNPQNVNALRAEWNRRSGGADAERRAKVIEAAG